MVRTARIFQRINEELKKNEPAIIAKRAILLSNARESNV